MLKWVVYGFRMIDFKFIGWRWRERWVHPPRPTKKGMK